MLRAITITDISPLQRAMLDADYFIPFSHVSMPLPR